MKTVLSLLSILVVLGAGYLIAGMQTNGLLDRGAAVYSDEPNSFVGEEGGFTVRYSVDAEAAQVTYENELYDLELVRSGSEAQYTNADQSVVFWEAEGEAFLKIDGVTVDGKADQAKTDLIELTVASERAECEGVGLQECLVVNGEFFFDEIEGFNYEPGYEYTLQVEKTERENVPADASAYKYSLVTIISKLPSEKNVFHLTDTTWQWSETFFSDRNNVTPLKPEAFTLTFSEEGQVSVTTDCNNGSGSYSQDENSLTFEALAATKKACQKETQEAQFFEMLSSITTYSTTPDSNLLLNSEGAQILLVPAAQ